MDEVKVRISYSVYIVRTQGLMTFAEAEWVRLNIPLMFRAFWLLRCAVHLYIYFSKSTTETLSEENWTTLGKVLLVRGCETLPAILGMASIFSWISGQVLALKMMIPFDERE